MSKKETEVITDVDEYVFGGDALIVPVSVTWVDEDVDGSKDIVERDVIEVSCPLEFVYNDANPNEEYVGSDAVEFLADMDWNSREILDTETIRFTMDGHTYFASFDATPLREYED